MTQPIIMTIDDEPHVLNAIARDLQTHYQGEYRIVKASSGAEALETAQEPITANAICPGYVLTPIVEKQIPDTMKEYDMTREEVIENVMLTRQPSKEFATVEQMGGTATFLCSDAAAQITGTTISVDGGWTAL